MYILIHIPKTGGTSLSKLDAVLRCPHSTNPIEIRTCWKDEIIFAVTRNPYSRFHSCWKHFSSKRPGDIWYEDDRLYIEECKSKFPTYKSFAEQVWNSNLRSLPHLKTMRSFIYRGNELQVDRILRLENLQADINDMFGKPIDIPKINSTPGNHWTIDTDPQIAEIVEEKFAEDFVTFGYDYLR